MVHDPLKQRASKLLADWLSSQAPWTEALAHRFAVLTRPLTVALPPRPAKPLNVPDERCGARFTGKRCKRCGSRQRYMRSKACIECAIARARARYQRKIGEPE